MRYTPFFTCVIALLFAPVVCSTALMAQEVVAENILFLNEDGLSYLNYYTVRSSYTTYGIWFSKEKYKSPEEALKNTLYFYPPDFTWDVTSEKNYLILKVPQGSYASLNMGHFEQNAIKQTPEGDFVYTNWDGKTKGPDGHYGFWNTPVNYHQYVYVWVFPRNIEIVEYRCNREGRWVKRGNTIAYYGNNVNDLVFTIRYRLKTNQMYRLLKSNFGTEESIQISQGVEGVKVTLGATVLFPSGSSELTTKGRDILKKFIHSLATKQNIRFIISGFTDNQPIKGSLKNKYPTNWELSAARALTVLHYLIENGIEEDQLEIRAFGPTRPVASNDTAEGRSKNRRIEILLTLIEESS